MFKNSKNICVYMSAFNEVDTSEFINYCIDNKKNISVPYDSGSHTISINYNQQKINISINSFMY